MTDLEFSKLKFARALISDNKCEKCGSSKDLQLHHKDGACATYNDLNPENYLLLCAKCHEKTYQAEDAKIQNDRNAKLVSGERYFFYVDFDKCEDGYIIKDSEVRVFLSNLTQERKLHLDGKAILQEKENFLCLH